MAKLTEMVFILDRSGSMGGLESDTIGGYNSLLEKQKQEEGDAVVTTVLFDDRVKIIHDRVDIKAVSPLTEKEYYVRGSTALLDALGSTVSRIANNHRMMKEEYRPDKVIFVVTTDGMENASREYTYNKVKQMVEHEKEKYGWEFLFLGANIDAAETAGRMGIDRGHSVNYHSDSVGTALNYKVVSDAVSRVRACAAPLEADWKAEIEDDYLRRSHE